MAGEKLSWDEVWPGLESQGWQIEQGPRGKGWQTYYLPPGIKRGAGFKNRVDYFDSKSLVLKYLSGADISAGSKKGLAAKGKKGEREAEQQNEDVPQEAEQQNEEPALPAEGLSPAAARSPHAFAQVM